MPMVPGFEHGPPTKTEDSGEVEVTTATLWKENRKLVRELIRVNDDREQTARMLSRNRETANMVRHVCLAAILIVFLLLIPKTPEVMLEILNKVFGVVSLTP